MPREVRKIAYITCCEQEINHACRGYDGKRYNMNAELDIVKERPKGRFNEDQHKSNGCASVCALK